MIADLACDLGISQRSLQRLTSTVLGLSPVRYIQQVRLERAIELLRTSELSLRAVAHAVGYQDATTLGTLIRRGAGSRRRNCAAVATHSHSRRRPASEDLLRGLRLFDNRDTRVDLRGYTSELHLPTISKMAFRTRERSFELCWAHHAAGPVTVPGSRSWT